jgi:receptor-type tyrosine-protein phosphatase F
LEISKISLNFSQQKTPGGVPIRPVVNLKVLERDPAVSIELEWERPSQTYGELRGYRVRWGVKDHKLHEEILGSHMNTKKIKDLERGIEYEFRIAGTNL